MRHVTEPIETMLPAAARTAFGRWATSTATIIALIATTMAFTLAGFFYLAHEQTRLAEARNDARELRVAVQAVIETDRFVLGAMAHPSAKPDPVVYGRIVGTLDDIGPHGMPGKVKRGANEVPAASVLASLKSGWDTVMAQLVAGDVDGARETYALRSIGWNMDAMLDAFSAALAERNRTFEDLQHRIERMILIAMAGQILAGALSIGAFVFASRRGALESEARAKAVSRADATREQVLRLFQMTDMLQSAGDLADANAVLKSTATELLPDLGGALYVFNNSRDRLALSTQWGPKQESLPETIGLGQCWALKRGKAHINLPGSSKLCCEHHHSADPCLEIPMIARGEILGLLQIFAEGEAAEARLEQIASVGAAIADAMSLALANLALRDKLRGQALRDPLTGLYNRRYMEDTLERVVRLAERERSEVSLIMIDLDHFKRLNDNYGHAKGDAVLRETASALLGNLRESDVACRYGGEELLVILPQCGLKAAATKAERLRIAIESLSEPNGAKVSASFGVAAIPGTSMNTRDMMMAADAALYQAKQEGRNRVVCAPERSGMTDPAQIAFDAELDAAE